MQSLVEEARVINVLSPAVRSSAATGDYINMKNYDKLTIIMQTGSVAVGGNVLIKEAKDVSGTSAATLNFSKYYKRTASTDTYTATSADSSGSADCITVGNADDNKTWLVEVRGEQLSNSFDCVTVVTPAAFNSANCAVVAVAHKARYGQSAPPTALT